MLETPALALEPGSAIACATPDAGHIFGTIRLRAPDLEPPSNVEDNIGIDRQLTSNISVPGAWFRRSLSTVSKTDNLLIAPSAYAAVQVTNSLTSQLMTIYNLKRATLGQNDVLDTTASNSDLDRRAYSGFDATFNARLPLGASMFGGWWSDRDVTVACDGDGPHTFIFCDQSVLGIPYRNNCTLVGAVPLPLDIQLGVSVQSYAGNPLNESWSVPATLFPGGRTTPVTVPLAPAGEKYLDRWTQADAGVKKLFSFGKPRVEGSLDLFNALKSNVILQRNQAFGTTLDQPQQILQPRLIRPSAQWKC